ncbi:MULTISPECIES: hypothetical protein [Psychrobacillus]|uniref:Uncharacterized protein n=1 Tax=Psychrobacillus faecigallinarum TaxID=2762235 RepID=A0ABR8RCR1_9BACI|nr:MULTISPECIES: hypothetical protein [Psychrobacillus]MBD7945546.1 hypothetical protein [Psychrobacillus faecigallinarum]QEY22302.1 hypothetical protein D0S48_17485 [Psychrobacillus sp. AK 1817]QGM29189.1 hypothetical protein GI482_01700 [Bacillus sp. N3536]
MTKAKWALVASIFALIGLPLIFLGISLYTGQWYYFLFSLPAGLTAGITGLVTSLVQIQMEKK